MDTYKPTIQDTLNIIQGRLSKKEQPIFVGWLEKRHEPVLDSHFLLVDAPTLIIQLFHEEIKLDAGI